MCFSAEASFGASIIVSGIGILAYKTARQYPMRLLAWIPIFFGIQQFAEGLVWVSINHVEWAWLLEISTYIFIIFAWVIWPIFVPFALLKSERDENRKKVLKSLFVLGILLAAILVYILLIQGVHAGIQDCSIQYVYHEDYSLSWLAAVAYISTTVLSTLISSISKVWLLGALNLTTYFISRIYYHEHVISVWCFFAALSSISILYIIVSENNKEDVLVTALVDTGTPK